MCVRVHSCVRLRAGVVGRVCYRLPLVVDGRVDIAATCAHHQTLKRGETHTVGEGRGWVCALVRSCRWMRV